MLFIAEIIDKTEVVLIISIGDLYDWRPAVQMGAFLSIHEEFARKEIKRVPRSRKPF